MKSLISMNSWVSLTPCLCPRRPAMSVLYTTTTRGGGTAGETNQWTLTGSTTTARSVVRTKLTASAKMDSPVRYENMRIAIAYPITPTYIINDINEFLSSENGMNQSRLAVLLQNRNPTSHFSTYGFLTFREWMTYLGFAVMCNRVWKCVPWWNCSQNINQSKRAKSISTCPWEARGWVSKLPNLSVPWYLKRQSMGGTVLANLSLELYKK